jgi:tRNA/rRNA methyltransferase
MKVLHGLYELERLAVVLVRPRNPLNIGAAARAMSNFGCGRLRVVNPYDVAFREARSAMGASEILAQAEEFNSVAKAVADCALVVGTTAVGHRELQHPLRRLDEGAGLIRERLRSERVALLFGSEKAGLSNQDLSYCHWMLHIPTRQEHISMNLGQAVAVCLYELARNAAVDHADFEDREEECEHAVASEVERITQMLLRALDASGYVKSDSEAATEEKVRRLVRRMNLDSPDADVWLGMLRQILWKLGRG